jgi:hypothetical protein
MERVVDTPGPGNVYVVRQIAVRPEQPAAIAAFAAGVEMHDLAARMNSGIGASRTDDFDGLIGDNRQRLLEALLDAKAGLLALPAVITRAVVFDAERDANVRDRCLRKSSGH